MINNNVRAIRKAKGVSQTYIARYLGITRQGYSSLELGRTEIRAESLRSISIVLDTQVEVFYDDKLTKSVIKGIKRKVQRSVRTARRKEAG